MTLTQLVYPLQDGFIHNWLAASPQELSVAQNDSILPIRETPADRDTFVIGEIGMQWHYVRCALDHLVHLSYSQSATPYVCGWAFTQIRLKRTRSLTFLLTTSGPTDVWLNGQHVFRQEGSATTGLQHARFTTRLRAGLNDLMVRCQGARANSGRMVVAVRIANLSEKAAQSIEIVVPSHVERPDRQIRLERLLEYGYLEEVVNPRGVHFNLRWDEGIGEELAFVYQIQDNQELIYVEGNATSDPTKPLDVGQEYRLFERPLWVVLRATHNEYYNTNLRYQRAIPIHVLDNDYAASPYSDFAARNQEALKDAVKFENNLFSEIAKMQLGLWKVEDWTHKAREFNPKVVLDAIERVIRGEVGNSLRLVGLLGIAFRFFGAAEFPEALKIPIEACLLNAAYEGAETESETILLSSAELLTGQRYPDQKFAVSGQSGQWHRQHGEQIALAWLKARGAQGFRDWNSNETFESHLVALAHLASLAENESLRELAAVLIDKIFFVMAVNSYKGAFAASHGRTAAGMVKSAQLEATSGTQRMMWGMGVFNHYIAGAVSLVCSGYEFPLLIAGIAADQPAEMWNRERHLAEDGFEVHTATYKTPDGMLASALDYRAGQLGNGEHIWQATLGQDAVVFVNHPGCASEDEAHLAGSWRGNAVLPRVAQWKDALLAAYKLPADDWMGFTHAYFPTFSFDAYTFRDGWAFAQKGNGYLALTAQRGIALIKMAPDGYRELRSNGLENTWICQMGRAELDGSFEDFQQKVLALPIDWQPARVNFTTLRDQTLTFGWQGPLMVDGQIQELGSKHIENPYCTADLPAKQMDISFQDYLMRLNFE